MIHRCLTFTSSPLLISLSIFLVFVLISLFILPLPISADNDYEPPSPLYTISHKMQKLPKAEWWPIASLKTGAGIVKRIWIAVDYLPPSQVFINGYFDNAASPQIGTKNTDNLSYNNSLAVDVLFTAIYTSNDTSYSGTRAWSSDTCGSNFIDSSHMDGFIALDMPFQNGFTFNLYSNIPGGYYRVQVDYTPLEIQSTPFRMHIQPYYGSGITNDPVAGKYPEFSFLGVMSPNGVYYKGLKQLIEGPPSGVAWSEGKYRIYSGGPGMPTGTIKNYTSTQPDEVSYYNQLPGVSMIGTSSGSEDYFLNGFNWANLGCFANNNVGTVYCGRGDTDVARLVGYRFYHESAYYAPPNTYLVTTWTANDQNLAGQAIVNFVYGATFYLA